MKLAKPTHKNLGALLKQAREQTDFSQSDIAAHFGWGSPQFMSNIERGLCAVPPEILGRLCEIYSLTHKRVIEAVKADMQAREKEAISRLRRYLSGKEVK